MRMKTIPLAALTAICCALPCGLTACSSPSQGLEYTLFSDSYYVVTGIGYCTDTHLVIPSTHNDCPVIAIEEGAFSNCSFLTKVTIPDSVTSIGSDAFSGCTALTTINIPGNVIEIPSKVFSGCSSLTKITLPNRITSIDSYAFYNCTALTSATIGNSVTSIGYGAFSACSALTNVTFKNTNGWRVYNLMIGGATIDSKDLANTATAATYLTSTYCDLYGWYRS